jgi:hypothetical protein
MSQPLRVFVLVEGLFFDLIGQSDSCACDLTIDLENVGLKVDRVVDTNTPASRTIAEQNAIKPGS